MAPVGMRHAVGNLPVELTSFVDRRRELTETKTLMSRTRCLTLTGMGGVGKTRLARRIARELHRAFPDGVWQAELADLREPALIVPTIAAALGLSEQNRLWNITTLQEQMKDQRVLLLLDNCEHLIDACALVADALLTTCPELHLLVTSREPLGIGGEHSYPVRPLPVPGSEDLTGVNVAAYESVNLFLDRATAVLPGFILDDHRSAVAKLVSRLDGVPLAIELAALQLRALSPEQILEQFDRRYLATSGGRSVPERQRSLHAVVDWSYQLCSEPEKQLWCILSVFGGGFELEAAQAVCADTEVVGPDVPELIVGLVEKSVLTREEQAGRVRLRMPEVIRAYGLDRVRERGMEQSFRRRHLDWYTAVTARAYEAWIGPDQFTWFCRMRQEHANLRAALDFSLFEANGAGHVVDIVESVCDYWIAFGFLSEGRHWLEKALERVPENDPVRGRALRDAAVFATLQGDDLPAAAMLRESRVLAEAAGEARELGRLAWAEGFAALQRADLVTAFDALQESRPLLQTTGDSHALANTLTTLVTVTALWSDASKAVDRAHEFLDAAEPLQDRWTTSWRLWAMGIAHWRLGSVERAGEYELRSLVLRQPFEDRLGSAVAIEVLSWIATKQGRPERAATLMGTARHALTAVGSSFAAFPYLIEDHQRCEAWLRGELGDRAFETAVDRGAQLGIDDVIALVAGKEDQLIATEAKFDSATSPLTPREHQTAELIAQGLSNKEIAAHLVIAQRTAEGHVEHILVKLGFSSRSQIARWVGERRTATLSHP
jgi:predicted ATPase/DNA-binding CsgD family transcriptional regulator